MTGAVWTSNLIDDPHPSSAQDAYDFVRADPLHPLPRTQFHFENGRSGRWICDHEVNLMNGRDGIQAVESNTLEP